MFKLMIVDDEPLTRQFFKTNISLMHPQWLCAGEAGDGEEALALLDQGEVFDLIVTDIKMPGMSGLELVQKLAERPSRPHTVILSGYDEFLMAKEAMKHGVHDYLLKPIVNEEVTAVLSKLASQLTAERSDEAAYRSLLSLSTESREQVARNFLRAVISDNNMEIKILYPMLHRLKISLLDAEGAIMIVDLDESQLFEREISASHKALYRYIVHQTANELTASSPGTIPFIDNEERTVLFVAGDDATDVFHRCQDLFEELSRKIVEMTNLHLHGALGSPEMEVLQLIFSYRKASQAMKRLLFTEPKETGTLFMDDTELHLRVRRLEKAVSTLPAASAEDLGMKLHASLQLIAKELEPMDRRKLVLIGLYILKNVRRVFPEETIQERIGAALQIMKQQTLSGPEKYSSADAVSLYRKMLESVYAEVQQERPLHAPESSEHEIVTKVKAYIMENFTEPISLGHIAEKMGLSYSYLSSLFHQNTQESYIKYLTRVRMEYAASLLRKKPAVKVYDVAEKIGYVSVKHFSYVFKQHFGIPPGQYQDKFIR
ncbi:response regulator transcription factor [Paenibacillus abyssi]|uniref:AraC family transcriptional regulator n=1 Tax=Paenibacillus abyssi TaxID=1340531 RepID=A0A917FKS3_9BACL|nr:response regulator [Paenibacillus abyssi]GGF90963.1 AraC family transcriptional regulator [Paenibacillus abyssi]